MKTKTTIIIFTIILLTGLVLVGNISNAKDYRLIKTADNAKVYLVKNDRRIHIPNEEVFEAGGYKWNEIEIVSQTAMNNIKDTALIKSPVDAKVYLINEGKKEWIPNETSFLGAGLAWSDIVLISQSQVEFYPEDDFVEDHAKEVATSIKKQVESITKDVVVVEKVVEVPVKGESDKVVIGDYKRPTKESILEVGNLRPEEPRTTLLGINNNGDAVGHSMKTGSRDAHPVVFKEGKLIDIGKGRLGQAKAINDLGQVVGTMNMSYSEGSGGGVDHAFLWENGVIKDLGGLSNKSYLTSIATDINNKGQVVGYSWIGQVDGFPVHAFLWENGVMKDIGTLGGSDEEQYTRAMAINESGQVVGCSLSTDGTDHPFVWQDGRMIELQNKYGERGCAVDINDNGEVLGYFYRTDGSVEFFIWKKGRYEIIPDFSGDFWLYSINNRGEVVGSGNGFVYYKDGDFVEYRDLNGWFLGGKEGQDINDRGQIVGVGTKTNLSGNYGVILSLPANMSPTFNFTIDGDNQIFNEEDKQDGDYPEFLKENPLQYKISWKDSDPDDDAKISLYYYHCDLNCQLLDFQGEGKLLSSNISENSRLDYYIWDMSNEAVGTYYFYAEIDDGNSRVRVDSDRLKKMIEIYSRVKVEDEEEGQEVIVK